MTKAFVLAALTAGVLLGAGSASAQRTQEPTAEELFTKATRDFEAGNVRVACEGFNESFKKHEGIGTLLNLGACYEKLGDLWRAYNVFVLARTRAADAGQRDRVNLASARMKDLEPQVARVQLSGNLQWITTIFVEGQPQLGVGPVDRSSRLEPFAVPSGRPLTITLSGPGRTIKPEVSLRQSELKTIDVPAAPAEAATGAPPVAAAAPSAEKEGGSKTLPLVLLGLGTAGIIVGSVTGLMAISKGDAYNEAAKASGCSNVGTKQCPDGVVASVNANADRDSAQGLATVSTISFVIGGLAAATGITLLLLPSGGSGGGNASTSARLTPTAGPTGGGVSLVGAF